MIHINNDGSGNPNLTFRFGFQNSNIDTKLTVGGKAVAIPLVINGGPINGRFPVGINVPETYNISLSSSAGEQAVTLASDGAQFFDKPIDNLEMKSIPDYESYARQHVYEIKVPGCANNGVNELMIGLKDKDKFNARRPVDDAANFADYVTNPTLPALIEILFRRRRRQGSDEFPAQ